jgi:FkbM family methyltransferase
MKQRVHKLFQRCGHDVIEYPLQDWFVLREHLAHVFRKLSINCVIDVGGHFGEYGLFLRELGYGGRIISVEPVRENFDILLDRAAGDHNWTAYNFALGETEGTSLINVARCTDFSSFLQSNEACSDRFGDKGVLERMEAVSVKRLDSILDELVSGIDNPRLYLKMDTQGWDLKVLRGASGVLARISALQSEVSVQNLYFGMTGYLDAIQQMSEMGFTVSGLFPVARDENALGVVEFDCVMVRSQRRTTASRGALA